MSKTATTWLLIGAPNSGKTSLFNALTGSDAEVMNYPGSTVRAQKAYLKKEYAAGVLVVDTPGVYGVSDSFPEETELKKILEGYKESPIVYVMDCRFVEHRLQLLKELLRRGRSCVVYCTHTLKSTVSFEELHTTYGISFIDSSQDLALKTLAYAVQNIGIQAPPPATTPTLPVRQANPYGLDRLILHSWLGLVSTLVVMVLIFGSIFYISQPISDLVECGVDQIILMLKLSDAANEYPLLISMICGGVLGGGALIVFTPQVFWLFVVVLFIQESGYLARAAVILDPIFQRVGLHGRSFVSLLSGFSCAVPAILLSKTIESKKERLITILTIPFMMCSARVPMVAMGVSFLLHDRPVLGGIIFAGFYFVSLFIGIVAAGIINVFSPSKDASFFMMELPPYKWPSVRVVMRAAANRVFMFLKGASALILGISLVIWFATTFPNYDSPNNSERVSQSYAAQIGQWMDPAFELLGVDWRVGTALIVSFTAREVFVPSITLLLGRDVTDTVGSGTFEQLRNVETKGGAPLFSFASVVSLLIFFMFALQCGSTVAVTAKEAGSRRVAFCQFVIMNGIAYTLAVIVYQILSRM